jgi:hypothetical protein
MVGHVMICRLSVLAVVILLPIRVPVAREASLRRMASTEPDSTFSGSIRKLIFRMAALRLYTFSLNRPNGSLSQAAVT